MQCVPNWPGALLTIKHARPGELADAWIASNTRSGRPLWILDYEVRRDLGRVVPQTLQLVRGSDIIDMPIFFVHGDGSVGVPLVGSSNVLRTLRGVGLPAPLGGKKTTVVTLAVWILSSALQCRLLLITVISGQVWRYPGIGLPS